MKKSIHVTIPKESLKSIKILSAITYKKISDIFEDFVKSDSLNHDIDKNKEVFEAFLKGGHRLHVRVRTDFVNKINSFYLKRTTVISNQKKVGRAMIIGFIFLKYVERVLKDKQYDYK